MPVPVKYDEKRADQITRIRNFANNSIRIIWLAGFTAILILMGYFLFFSESAQQAVNRKNERSRGLTKLADETVFADKTTLVNIGLRMQAIREDSSLQTNGTISINKIIHDQKLNKIKKAEPAPVTAKKKVDFAIKAVPK